MSYFILDPTCYLSPLHTWNSLYYQIACGFLPSGFPVNVLGTTNSFLPLLQNYFPFSVEKFWVFSVWRNTQCSCYYYWNKGLGLKKKLDPWNSKSLPKHCFLWNSPSPLHCCSSLNYSKRRIPFQYSSAIPVRVFVRTSSTTLTFLITAQSWRSRSRSCKRWAGRRREAGKSVTKLSANGEA